MRKFFLLITAVFFLVALGFLPLLGKASPILYELFFNKNIELKKTNKTINVLLLGIGGGKHDGPNLTDTIMVANINPEKNKVTFISIPRDLWIPEFQEKINTAYAIGESKQRGGGIVLAKAVVEKITQMPIAYAVRVDFNGYVKAVDYIGGLDIIVDKTFDDYQYPIEENREDLCGHTLEEATVLIATMEATMVFPCRYKHLHFDKGLQHFNGEQSLMYVRSRYGTNDEGSDFARSMRQQKVIKAFRDKMFSLGTILNPVRIANLYNTVSESIDSDIHNKELDDFIKLGQQMKQAEIRSFVVDAQDLEKKKPGLLINPPLYQFGGSWVLIPRTGEENYKEIQDYIKCVLVRNDCVIK